MAALAWAGAWIGVSGWRPSWVLLAGIAVAGVVVIGVAAHRRVWWLAVCVLVAVSSSMAAGARSAQLHDSPVARAAEQGAVGTLEFRVRNAPRPAAQVVVVDATVVSMAARRKVIEAAVPLVVLASGERGGQLTKLAVGATYRATVKLGAASPTEPAVAVASVRSTPELSAAPGALDAAASRLRQGLRDSLAHSLPAQAALVPSLVVGDRSLIDEELAEQFRTTGLTHLLAVSGANLSLMLGVVLAAARACGARGWLVRVLAVGGVAAFIVLCGSEPSVLRAAAMGIVAVASIGVGRGRRSLRALSLAVFGLLWIDPWLARSVGFALSAAAVAGIVLLGPPLLGSLTRWCPRWVAEALAIPIAAQLATQPLVTAISDEVSVVGVLANVLAGPFVGPTTVLGFAAALTSLVPVAAVVPGFLAGWCAQPILWVAAAGAALPGAAWSWPVGPASLLALVVGAATLGVLLVVVLRSPWGVIGLIVLLAAAAVIRPVPLGWPGTWEVVFCDVGQGDATVARAGPRSAVLIDAGPQAAETVACLAQLGVDEVPLLVLTHYHADHTGGATSIIARYRPAVVLVRGGSVPQWLSAEASKAGSLVRLATPGEAITVGQVRWRTVATGDTATTEESGEGSAENDASVVGIASVGQLDVLLPGDVEPQGQAEALRNASRLGIDLGVEVLKLPHHGSARQEPRFFAATGAELAVASAGQGNDYGHPAAAALERSAANGMSIARTDQQGSVAVALESGRLIVRGMRTP